MATSDALAALKELAAGSSGGVIGLEAATALKRSPSAPKKLTFTLWVFSRMKMRSSSARTVPATAPVHIPLVRVGARRVGLVCASDVGAAGSALVCAGDCSICGAYPPSAGANA